MPENDNNPNSGPLTQGWLAETPEQREQRWENYLAGLKQSFAKQGLDFDAWMKSGDMEEPPKLPIPDAARLQAAEAASKMMDSMNIKAVQLKEADVMVDTARGAAGRATLPGHSMHYQLSKPDVAPIPKTPETPEPGG